MADTNNVDNNNNDDNHLPTTTISTKTTTTTSTEISLPESLQPSTAGIFVSSIILLVAVVSRGEPSKGNGYWAYGIALSIIAITLTLITIYTNKPELVKESPNVPFYMNNFIFLWCFLGACIMTFGDGPFTNTSNGYFAAWGMAIFAVMGLGYSITTNHLSALTGHLVASIVIIIAISSTGFDHAWKGETIYGLIMACLSCIIVIYQAKTKGIPISLTFPIFAVLAICWTVSASLMTFRGPFEITGNGYFASWGGAVTAFFCAVEEYR